MGRDIVNNARDEAKLKTCLIEIGSTIANTIRSVPKKDCLSK
jgi:hypothetical protein